MRVWIVNHFALSPHQPGGARHFLIARVLRRNGADSLIVGGGLHHLSDRDHVPKGQTSAPETRDSVRFHWLRTPSRGTAYVARIWNIVVFSYRLLRLTGLQGEPRPDVVMGTSPDLLSAVSAWAVARRLKVPFVLEIRDVWPQSLVEIGRIPRCHPIILFFSMLERFLYRHADWIVTLLPGTRPHIEKCGGDPHRITWVPNGVDLDDAPAVAPPPANRPFTVMYAGSHGAANDLETLLTAARILKERGCADGLRIRLIGDGPLKENLLEVAQERCLDFVTFEKPVPKEQVQTHLSEADAFCICFTDRPLYRLGVSANKIFDYMVAGRPILIALSAANNPVEDAECGITVPSEDPYALADAILKLASMPVAERDRIGRNGRTYVERHHSYANLGKRLTSVLEQVVSTNKAETDKLLLPEEKTDTGI